VTEAVLAKDGRFEHIRIANGLPGGLNELAIATFRKCRCNPALKDGRLVVTLIPINCSEIRVLAAMLPVSRLERSRRHSSWPEVLIEEMFGSD
jgi:hypothetical protein